MTAVFVFDHPALPRTIDEAIRDAEADLNAAVDTLQQALVDGDIPAALQQVKQCEIALAERNRLCKVSKHG